MTHAFVVFCVYVIKDALFQFFEIYMNQRRIIKSSITTTRNSSGDEIANVKFLRRHCSRTTAHNKVHFAYGKHTCPRLPNETLTIIDSRVGLNRHMFVTRHVTVLL